MQKLDIEQTAKELGTTPEEVQKIIDKVILDTGVTLDRIGKLAVARDPRRDITAPGAFQEHHKLPVDARKARRLKNKARRGKAAAGSEASQRAYRALLATLKTERKVERAHG